MHVAFAVLSSSNRNHEALACRSKLGDSTEYKFCTKILASETRSIVKKIR